MADRQETERLLKQLADRTGHDVPDGLAQRVKERIPHNLHAHRGLDTVNIIIDLRISKVAAAIIILASLLLFATFFHRMEGTNSGVYDDLKVVVARLPGTGASKSEILSSVKSTYERLLKEGKEVVYLGDSCDLSNHNAIMMYWKVDEGRYAVVFADMRLRTISSDMLIRLQSAMLDNAGR